MVTWSRTRPGPDLQVSVRVQDSAWLSVGQVAVAPAGSPGSGSSSAAVPSDRAVTGAVAFAASANSPW